MRRFAEEPGGAPICNNSEKRKSEVRRKGAYQDAESSAFREGNTSSPAAGVIDAAVDANCVTLASTHPCLETVGRQVTAAQVRLRSTRAAPRYSAQTPIQRKSHRLFTALAATTTKYQDQAHGP